MCDMGGGGGSNQSMFSASALGHHSPPVPQSKVLGLRA